MGRATARFEAISPFAGPATQGFSMSLLTAQEWQNLATVLNCERVDVDPLEETPRTQAVMPTWEYGDEDTRLADWTVLPAPDEEAEVAIVETNLDSEISILEAKDTLTTEERQRLEDLYRDLEQVQTWRYWQDVENAFGNGATAIYRACNSPNVPYKLRSNGKLQPDRPFTLWLHRAKPHEGQQSTWLRLRFGYWALTIKQEAEVELTRYRHGRWYEDSTTMPGRGRGTWHNADGTNWANIEAVEAQVQAIRDDGRLTAEEKEQVATYKAQIATLRQQMGATVGLSIGAKAALKADLGAQIKTIQAQIDALKQSKFGLTAGQEAQIAALEKSIIADRKTLTFAHMAESLLNNDFCLTFIPQPRGFLVIHNSRGRDYVVYENEDVTATGDDAVLVSNTPLQIDGNGGAFWFGLTWVKPAISAYIESRERTAGEVAAALTTLSADKTIPSGTTITPSVVVDETRNSFTWRVDFTTSGSYLPFLYRLYLDIPPTPRDPDAEEVIFDSSDHSDVHWEVGADYSRENRGRAVTLTLSFPTATHPELLTLAHKQVKLYEEEDCWFTGVFLGPDETVELKGGLVRCKYQGYDRWFLFRTDRMYYEVIGDGKTKKLYATQLAQGLGLTADEIVISGAVMDQVLPNAPPGDQPLFCPEFGAARADWLQELHKDWFYLQDMWFDGDGALHIEPLSTLTAPAFAYHSTRTGADDLLYMMEPKITQAWDEFVNIVAVYGREVYGYKLAQWYSDYSSRYDTTSSRYVGRWLSAEPYENSALRTQAQVNAACRWRQYLQNRPYEEVEFSTAYNRELTTGDRITVDGLPVEVISLNFDRRAEGMMTVRVRQL